MFSNNARTLVIGSAYSPSLQINHLVKFNLSSFRFSLFILCISSCICSAGYGKDPARIVRAGIQFKPIFPVEFLHTGTQSVLDNGVNYSISLKSGFNGGMVIRKGFTNLLSFETGINYVKRKYELDITDSSHNESSQFRIVGYEIPLSALVYIQLGEYFFMNASMGASADMFASNVESKGENHTTLTVRRNIFQPAIIANLGWEARTAKAGYFYLGTSLHRPFNDVFVTGINYNQNNIQRKVGQSLNGSYLTFDVRYFFPEGAKKKSEE